MPSRCWQVCNAIIALVACSAAPLAHAEPSCDALDPCAAKTCRLDADIAQAKARGSNRELARLQRARAEMAHCSDEGLKQKRNVALEQAQRRIDQRTADLQRAEASGDAKKIKKAQSRLESARKVYSGLESSPL